MSHMDATRATLCAVPQKQCFVWQLPSDCLHLIVHRLCFDDVQSLWMTGSRDICHVLANGNIVRRLSVMVNVPLADHAYQYRWPISTRRYGYVQQLELRQVGEHATVGIYWLPSMTIPLSHYLPKTLTRLCLANMVAPLAAILMAPPLVHDAHTDQTYHDAQNLARACLDRPSNTTAYKDMSTHLVLRGCMAIRQCSPWVHALPNLVHFEYTYISDDECERRDEIYLWVLILLPPTLQILSIPDLNVATWQSCRLPSFQTYFPLVRNCRDARVTFLNPRKLREHVITTWIDRMILDDNMATRMAAHKLPRIASARVTQIRLAQLRRNVQDRREALPTVPLAHRDMDRRAWHDLQRIFAYCYIAPDRRETQTTSLHDLSPVTISSTENTPAVSSLLLDREAMSFSVPPITNNAENTPYPPYIHGLLRKPKLAAFMAQMLRMWHDADLKFLETVPHDVAEQHNIATLLGRLWCCVYEHPEIATAVQKACQHLPLAVALCKAGLLASLDAVVSVLMDARVQQNLVAHFRTICDAHRTQFPAPTLCVECGHPLVGYVGTATYGLIDATSPNLEPLTLGSWDANSIPKAPEFTHDNMIRAVEHLNQELVAILHEQNVLGIPDVFVYGSVRVREALYLAIGMIESVYGNICGHATSLQNTHPSKNRKIRIAGSKVLSWMVAACITSDDNDCVTHNAPMATLNMSLGHCYQYVAQQLKDNCVLCAYHELKNGFCAAYRDIRWTDLFILLRRYLSVQLFELDSQYESTECHVGCDATYYAPTHPLTLSTTWHDLHFAMMRHVWIMVDEEESNDDDENPEIDYHDPSAHGVHAYNLTQFGDEYRVAILSIRDGNSHVQQSIPLLPSLSSARLHISTRSPLEQLHKIWSAFADAIMPLHQLTRLNISVATLDYTSPPLIHPLQCLVHLPKTLTHLTVAYAGIMNYEPVVWPHGLTKLTLQHSCAWRGMRHQSLLNRDQLRWMPPTLTTLVTNRVAIDMLHALPRSLTKLKLTFEDPIDASCVHHLQHVPPQLKSLSVDVRWSVPLWGRVHWPTTLMFIFIWVHDGRTFPNDDVWNVANTAASQCIHPYPCVPSNLQSLTLDAKLAHSDVIVWGETFVHALPKTLRTLIIGEFQAQLSPRACAALGPTLPNLETLQVFIHLTHDTNGATLEDCIDMNHGRELPPYLHVDILDYANRYIHVQELQRTSQPVDALVDASNIIMYQHALHVIHAYMLRLITSLPRNIRQLVLHMGRANNTKHILFVPFGVAHYDAMPRELRFLESYNMSDTDAAYRRQRFPRLQIE